MADKRMFHRAIVQSDDFYELPLAAQALYFHLNLSADNDGFISNVRAITRAIGAKQDDLEKLIPKYMYKFDSGVYVIRHWNFHNKLKKDRYVATTHTAEKEQLQLIGDVYFMDAPDVPEPKAKPAKKPAVKRIGYGTYQNIMLTDDEYEAWQQERPADFAARINAMSEWCQSKGHTYKDYLAALRSWARKDGAPTVTKAQPSAVRSNEDIFADFLGENNELF